MTLYQSDASPNSRRVRLFVAEKGICMPTVPVDLAAGEQRSASFAAINPRLVVPVLVLDDGTAIGEVPAIFRYLEEVYPAHPLMGSTAKEKALVVMWERRMELEGFAVVIETVRNRAPGLAGRAIAGPRSIEQIPALVDRGLVRFDGFLADLEERLAQVPFVAGDAYSAADITALATIDFALKALNITVPEGHGHVRAWYAKVASRASAGA